MGRYDNNDILINKIDLKNKLGVKYKSSTRYPNIDLSIDDVFLYTMRGDRLDNLAYQFYKDPSLWWILSIANPDLPNDSLYPTLGFQLRIPSNVIQIINNFELLNS